VALSQYQLGRHVVRCAAEGEGAVLYYTRLIDKGNLYRYIYDVYEKDNIDNKIGIEQGERVKRQ
jgi:hypothetical protein